MRRRLTATSASADTASSIDESSSVSDLVIVKGAASFRSSVGVLHGGFYLGNAKAFEKHIKATSSAKKVSSKLAAKLEAEVEIVSMQEMLGGKTVEFLSSGQSHVLVVRRDGEVVVLGPSKNLNSVVWGASPGKPVKVGIKPVGAAAGLFHSVVWDSETLVSWGYNINCSVLGARLPANQECGQLGRSGLTAGPGQVLGLSGAIKQAACGNSHTLVLTGDGLFGFGLNTEGQLGGDPLAQPVVTVPRLINLPVDVVSVACGGHHSLAITKERAIYSWGWNSSGQLGLSERKQIVHKPTRITSLAGVVLADAGNFHSVAITAKGHVYSFGANHEGALGRKGSGAAPGAVALPRKERVVSVSCCGNRSAVTTISGKVYVWGSIMGPRYASAPTPLQLKDAPFSSHVSLGTSHLALLSASEVDLARSVLGSCMKRGEVTEADFDILSSIPEPYWTQFQKSFVSELLPRNQRVVSSPASFLVPRDAAHHNFHTQFKVSNASSSPTLYLFLLHPESAREWVNLKFQDSLKMERRVEFPFSVVAKASASLDSCAFVKVQHGKNAHPCSFIRFMPSQQDPSSSSSGANMLHVSGPQTSTTQVNPLMALVHQGKALKRKCSLDSNLWPQKLVLNLVRYWDREQDANAYLITLPMWSSVPVVLKQLDEDADFLKRKKRVTSFLEVLVEFNDVEPNELAQRCAKKFDVPQLVAGEVFPRELFGQLTTSDDPRIAQFGLAYNKKLTERGLRAQHMHLLPRHDAEYFGAARSLFEGFNVLRVTVGTQDQAVDRAKCEEHLSAPLVAALVSEGLVIEIEQGSYLEASPYYAYLLKRDLAGSSTECGVPPQLPAWNARCELMQGDPRVFALQLGCIMQLMYSRVRPLHFVKRNWDSDGNPLGDLFRLVRSLSGWIATVILSAGDQAERFATLERAIQAAMEMYRMGNFSGVFALVLGVNQHVLSRLELSKNLPSEATSEFELLLALVSQERNYQAYKDRLALHEGPTVPHVGITVTAVTYCLDGNETLVNGKVNRQKAFLVADVISRFTKYQSRPSYKVEFHPGAYAFFASLASKVEAEDDLYEKSYAIKPKK